MADAITSADHPFTAVLLRILEHTPDPDGADVLAAMAVEDMKEEILKAIAPIAHQPQVFDRLMRLAEADPPAPATTLDPLWNELFSSWHEDTSILPRLTDAQAERAARAMVATRLTHPSIHARNAAGHQLCSFDHVGAQDYLIEALDEYGRRYAASTEKSGKVFDHGETEDDLLQDTVANLYSAVRKMGTPLLPDHADRAAVHRAARVLADGRRDRRDLHRGGPPRDDVRAASPARRPRRRLLRLRPHRLASGRARRRWSCCGSWRTAGAAGGDRAALLRVRARHRHRRRARRARVRAGAHRSHAPGRHRRTAAGPSTEHAGGRAWTNPLARKGRAAQLEAVLSGRADAERRRLLDKGTTARAAGKPRRKISDKNLGILAQVTVRRRILHDRASGEVWFLDTDGAVHVFDGYEITEPPFRVRPAGHGRMREFLAGVTELSERALFWDRRAAHHTETVRYGDRLTVRWGGHNTGSVNCLGLHFPDAATAAEAFTRLGRSIEASGMSASSPWYLPGKGAVVRTYHTSGGDGETDHLSVFEDRADRSGSPVRHRRRGDRRAPAVELEAQRDRNAFLGCLEWDGGCLRREDMTGTAVDPGRIRDDSADTAWHVSALTEITEYLTTHGYGDLIAGAASRWRSGPA